MSNYKDRVIGDEWFTTIYLDAASSNDTIHMVGGAAGLLVQVSDENAVLSDAKVRELRLALSRYERWRGNT